MQSSPSETASFLLRDLDRWTFGALLARRAAWDCADSKGIEAVVKSYRLAIIHAVLKVSGSKAENLAQEVSTQRALAAAEHAPYLEPSAAWEFVLAHRFLERMRSLAPFNAAEAPLTRFAHGQYFKYSRRVSYLLKLPVGLPASYAPASQL